MRGCYRTCTAFRLCGRMNIDIVAVANPDGSPNSESNPAAVNSVVGIYFTGGGQTSPPFPAGHSHRRRARC
jgi:uncharacterized protein (TIGR03437 family)